MIGEPDEPGDPDATPGVGWIGVHAQPSPAGPAASAQANAAVWTCPGSYAERMFIRVAVLLVACTVLGACAGESSERGGGIAGTAGGASPGGSARELTAQPLTVGETFTVDSRIMREPRRVNVLVPTVYGQKIEGPLPVLYMLDGGLDEDFLHVAGLVQVLASNGGMRPFLLVGIPNTSRRRDMTGPTSSAEDRKIAPEVGGSATFRRFIKEELMPTVRARYQTTEEAAIIGESLAGLFVLETFFVDPDMFGTYIALDPSLWWADQSLLRSAGDRLGVLPSSAMGSKNVFLASSSEPALAAVSAQLAAIFESHRGGRIAFHYVPMPTESHASIYHPAALQALRTVCAPPPAAGR